MPSWGNTDAAANAPLWAAATVNLSPNTTNITSLFDNTTANSFAVTLADGSVRQGNVTYGLFNVDASEVAVAKVDGDADSGGEVDIDAVFVHAGWNIVKTGQGGRAGRIQTETLVCLNTVVGDADGQLLPNVGIILVGPTSASITSNATYYANVATFTTVPTVTGNTNANITYTWQINNASGTWGWVAIPANTANIHFAGSTTASLYAMPGNTANNTNVLRVIVAAPDEGVSVTSANATLSIPA